MRTVHSGYPVDASGSPDPGYFLRTNHEPADASLPPDPARCMRRDDRGAADMSSVHDPALYLNNGSDNAPPSSPGAYMRTS